MYDVWMSPCISSWNPEGTPPANPGRKLAHLQAVARHGSSVTASFRTSARHGIFLDFPLAAEPMNIAAIALSAEAKLNGQLDGRRTGSGEAIRNIHETGLSESSTDRQPLTSLPESQADMFQHLPRGSAKVWDSTSPREGGPIPDKDVPDGSCPNIKRIAAKG